MSHSQYITRCALFCALGALLPQAFHFFGIGAGQTFLPMHIPALCAGLLMGPGAGASVGFLSPLLSCLVTGGSMPAPIKLPFMMLEVATYGVCCALAYARLRKTRLSVWFGSFLSVLFAQLCGRAVNALGTAAAVYLFGVSDKAVSMAAVWTAVLTGLPGIVLQLVVLPTLLVTLQRLSRPSVSDK